jgi:hypothetical protein
MNVRPSVKRELRVEITLADFETVALKLASRSGFRQRANAARWFSERETGTKKFMERMREQRDLLRKVIDP